MLEDVLGSRQVTCCTCFATTSVRWYRGDLGIFPRRARLGGEQGQPEPPPQGGIVQAEAPRGTGHSSAVLDSAPTHPRRQRSRRRPAAALSLVVWPVKYEWRSHAVLRFLVLTVIVQLNALVGTYEQARRIGVLPRSPRSSRSASRVSGRTQGFLPDESENERFCPRELIDPWPPEPIGEREVQQLAHRGGRHASAAS